MVSTVETFITFGSQYGRDPERHIIHPLGMTGDGYAVIEAPDRETARKIAFAVFGEQFAFDYEFAPPYSYAPEGELLRIAWQEDGEW